MESTWSKLAKLFWVTYGLLLLASQFDGTVAMVALMIVMAPVAVAALLVYCTLLFPIWLAALMLAWLFPNSRFAKDNWKWSL
jgi:hypothetical protein